MVETFRRERPLILAIAGFFLLLPIAMLSVFAPPPEPAPGQSPFPTMVAYIDRYQLEIMVSYLWAGFGQFAIVTLLAAPDRPSVGEALRRCLGLLPWYLLLYVILSFVLMGGLLMFVLPALYFAARLSLCTVLLGAGEAKNPFELMRRSIELTKGAGWHIAAFLLLIWFGTNLFESAVRTVSIALFKPFSGSSVASVAEGLIGGAASMPVFLLSVLFSVSLWRALRDPA